MCGLLIRRSVSLAELSAPELALQGQLTLYRRWRWRLPLDYPKVAPNYTARRSEFAKKFGLPDKLGSISFERRKPQRPLRTMVRDDAYCTAYLLHQTPHQSKAVTLA